MILLITKPCSVCTLWKTSLRRATTYNLHVTTDHHFMNAGTIEFPSGVSGFTNFANQTSELDAEDDFQEFDLDLDDEDEGQAKLILQPGPYSS